MSDYLENLLRAERDVPLTVAPDERIWRDVRRKLARDRNRSRLLAWYRWWPVLLLVPALGLAIAQWRTPAYALSSFALPQVPATGAEVPGEVGRGQASLPERNPAGKRSQTEREENFARIVAEAPSLSDAGSGRASATGTRGTLQGRTSEMPAAPAGVPGSRTSEPSRLATSAAEPAAARDLGPLNSESAPPPSGRRGAAAVGSLYAARTAPLVTGPAAALYLPPEVRFPPLRPAESKGRWSVRLGAGVAGWDRGGDRFVKLNELQPPFTSTPRTFFTPSGEPLHFSNAIPELPREREFRPVLRTNLGYRFRSGIRLGIDLTFAQLANTSPMSPGPELGPGQAYQLFFSQEQYWLGGLTVGYEKDWGRLMAYAGITLGRVGYQYRYSGSRLVYPARDLDFPLSTLRKETWRDLNTYSGLDLTLGYRLNSHWTLGPSLSLYSAISDSEFATLSLQLQYTLPHP